MTRAADTYSPYEIDYATVGGKTLAADVARQIAGATFAQLTNPTTGNRPPVKVNGK